eukprot:TRINITY_DN12321_c0_g1_i1.p1 TRINITY_DN12321_c0_g1~~TRINITY_DN12321_c0_g1_i1.p1  ORF type:complete len:279 (-),score=84.88 TRINITY_DN12321_c0_g1_i1:7-843(-)
MKFAIIVMGPAGSGKSTFCEYIARHIETKKRSVQIVNLDPAAEDLRYQPSIDIRDLISIDDVMEELDYGPNGALIYCMEYLLENIDWFSEQLGDYDNDYILIDCPGQVELYSHVPVIASFVNFLKGEGYSIVGTYLLDSHFITEAGKYISGVLACLSAMVRLEIPHVNVLTKMDLCGVKEDSEEIEKFVNPDMSSILPMLNKSNPRFEKLNRAIAAMLENYSMVQFLTMNINDTETLENILLQIDNALQFEEEQEVETKDFEPDTTEEVNFGGVGDDD